MLYYKNDNVVRSKHLKLNMPYKRQLAMLPTATAVCANKKWSSDESDKMMTHDLRSARRRGTMQEFHALTIKSIKMSTRSKS
jgi:hypothetical protein